MIDDSQWCMVCQLPQSSQHCVVTMPLSTHPSENKEQSDHEDDTNDVGCNMVEYYYDHVSNCEDADSDVYEMPLKQ